jgi:predicted permease
MWIVRLAALFRKNRLEQGLDQDIQEHLEMATEENIRLGMNPRQAAEAAKRSFGGLQQMKEEFRDQRGIPVWETLSRETRFACRSLGRAPGFTFLAILTLALAIGANSAIFSAVNALLFNPAGISEPGRVVVIRARYEKMNITNVAISLSDFNDVGNSREIFSAVAIAKTANLTYMDGAYPQRLAGLRVSWRWFEVLGAQPAHGRVFTAEEDQPDNNQVVVLSDAAWTRVFGRDPSIVGKSIDLDQHPYKVIGIMRPDFAVSANEMRGLNGQSHDLYVPLAARADSPQVLYTESYLGVAHVRPGIALAKAQAFMGVLTNRGFQQPLAGRFRKKNGWGLSMLSYTDYVGGDMKTPILILWGAVGFVLLIACANIAGLMLARTSARAREFAVRTALGSSRWHLLRQILAESAMLSLAGSLLGVGVAYVFIRAVEIMGPESFVGGLRIPFDLRMLIFTAAAGILSGLLFGFAPAGQLRRGDHGEALREGGRSGTAGRERTRLRSVLVTTEVALALILSIGAGLLLRSLSRLQQVDPGFRPEGVMSAAMALPGTRYKNPVSRVVFYRSLIPRLTALPGVKSAAAAYPIPFGTGFEGRAFQIVGRPTRANEPAPIAQARFVTPDFFSTLRIPLIRGRVFTDEDSIKSAGVLIIDETLAKQYFPNEDPLGRQIMLSDGRASAIVGVVGHTKQSDLAADSEKGVLYYCLYQQPSPFTTLVVRSAGNRALAAGAIREAVNAVDPALSIYDVKSIEQRISATLAVKKFTIVLLALFAGTAVFLAALGLYGVINYGVTQRTQEIGIRMALGAQRSQVLTLIVGSGLRITMIGLGLGWIAAFGIARGLPNQLFGVSAFDPVTFAAMGVLLAAVALLASYVPARRATKLDPLEACRYE